VEIGADTRKLEDGLSKTQSMLGNFAAFSAAGLATKMVTAGLQMSVQFIKESTLAASDLSETINKVQQSFGPASSTILTFAQKMADQFGLVKTTTLDAAANLGLIAQGAGLSAGEAAKLSTNLVQLAADASSFYNVPLEEALSKIRSGLVGEAEPLRAFGVLLSEDAVKAEAYSSGIAKVGQELDDQQKVMARSQIIIKSLETVSGDLERTEGGLANQMRKLSGDIENAKAKIGEGMVPIAQELIKVGYEIANSFNDISAASKIAFDTTPLEAFQKSLGSIRDGLIGLRIGLRGLISGNTGAAAENEIWRLLGDAMTKAGAAPFALAGAGGAKTPAALMKEIKSFGLLAEAEPASPFGLAAALSPFGFASPLGLAAMRTPERAYERTSQRMSVEAFGADAISKSLTGTQSPLQQMVQKQKEANEHLQDILQEMQRGNARQEPGRGGVFPRKRK
jgi:hypothetical protein